MPYIAAISSMTHPRMPSIVSGEFMPVQKIPIRIVVKRI